jgi:DNA-binding MarR family transcriptional regulator
MPNVPRLEVLEAKARRYPDMDPVACEAYLMLRQVGDAMRASLEKRLAAEGISHGRFMLLIVLDREPDQPLAASELAEQAGVTKQTITSLLDGLERDQYVDRNPHPQDRRSVVVTLLPRGRELLERIMPPMYRRQVEMLGDLSREEQQTLTRLLKKIQLSADEQGKADQHNAEAVSRAAIA